MDEQIAERNIKENYKRVPQVMEPQPQLEHDILIKTYTKIYNTVQDIFPEVREVLKVYIFDKAESDRTECYGQCNRFQDGTVAIGICIVLVWGDVQKLKYVLMHEIAHLRYWRHEKNFHDTLDKIMAVYNMRTGENVEEYEEM